MIQETKAYKVGEMFFPTIQQAQKQELLQLLSDGGEHTEVAKSVIDSIINHVDEVVSILTDTPKPKSPRKPRSDLGTKRKPKAPGPELEAK